MMPDAMKLEPEGWSRKPTIDELRAILNHEEDFEYVILPNGEIRSPSDEILDNVIALQKAQDEHDDRPENIQENPKSWCAWKAEAERLQALLDARTPSTTASTEGAWQPIETVGVFEEVTVYEAGNGQAIGHRDAMGEWWSPLPLRPLNMNPTHWKPLGPNPAKGEL